MIESGEIVVEKVDLEDNLLNMYTKLFPRSGFKNCLDLIDSILESLKMWLMSNLASSFLS